MMMLSSKKQPAPFRRTLRRATVLTAALGLLLACGGGGKQEEEYPRTHFNLSALPEGCERDRACGGLVGVDCDSAVDGPYYYVEERTGRVVETCGGACMGGPKPDQGICVECPPREWTCD
ncbi:hypothetical protein [Archangium sp.]|uniref:hypothetical protein n=1 Tax=Archangium sp. TaxID=1872627 RepID=UPI002D4E8798|nr:hypothetical protein [Archangium sp.]HYO55601.1 hypothetical protein [Archangium sp.]